jgi:hypothetical protein
MSMHASPRDVELIRRLREALDGWGFDTSTRAGRQDISVHSNVAVATLDELFDDCVMKTEAVARLCQTVGVPVEELLADVGASARVVTVFPYEGGTPIRLIIPQEVGIEVSGTSLFYLRVSSGPGEPASLLIGTRAAGSPLVGATYTVEDEISIDIMTCAASGPDGVVLIDTGKPEKRVHLGATPRLKIVGGVGAPEPQVTGRVLWQVSRLLSKTA